MYTFCAEREGLLLINYDLFLFFLLLLLFLLILHFFVIVEFIIALGELLYVFVRVIEYLDYGLLTSPLILIIAVSR